MLAINWFIKNMTDFNEFLGLDLTEEELSQKIDIGLKREKDRGD